MADRYNNRDRSRPYQEGGDERFYDRDFRSRGQLDRGFEEDYEYGEGEGFNRYNRGDMGSSSGYGRYSGGFSRDLNFGSDYDFDYSSDYGDNNIRDNWGRSNYSRGAIGGQYYGENRDWDYGYGSDYDRWNRGSTSGSGYGTYGRNINRYGDTYGAYGQAGYGRLGQDRGGYGTGYSGYGRGMDRFGQSRYGRYGQGTMSGGYGTMGRSIGDETDWGGSWGRDYDYDFDASPAALSYSDVWAIPGPFTGFGPQGYRRSDERILDDVNERLTRHGRLDARNIQVQVKDGEVTLTGMVDSRQAKRMAEDAIESISGVREVNNELRLQKQQDWQESQSPREGGAQQLQQQSQRQRTKGRS